MIVHFVGVGPGAVDLLTLRAARLIERARVCIYAGSLIADEILALLPPNCERHDSATLTLDQTTALCVDARARDLDVVRLHSGEPSIYGAIGEQMRALDALAIDYDVTPGISSFQAAAAALRTELTAPEISQTVILTRTAGRTPLPATQELARLAAARATLCLFLSTHNARHIQDALLPEYGATCPVAVVYHASRADQRIVRTTLAELDRAIADAALTRTAMIVVGHVLAPTSNVSRLYDASFTHGYREASKP